MHRRLILAPLLAVMALAGTGCGEQGIQLSENDPNYAGALLFQQRCAACHTLEVAGGEGSATKANSRERKDGPNFNVRAEDYESVLYAIRNGGFSSGPMPQNLVVGEEARQVACFVARYSGRRNEDFEGQGGAAQAERTENSDLEPTTGQTGGTGLPEENENCPQ